MAKKRPAGQRKGSAKLKSENLLVRLEQSEKVAFAAAADLAGIALSAWVRERLRWAAVKELQAADQQVPFLGGMVHGEEDATNGDKGHH